MEKTLRLILWFSTRDRKTLLCYVQFINHLNCQLIFLNLNQGRKVNFLLKGLLHFPAIFTWTLCSFQIDNSYFSMVYITTFFSIFTSSRKSCLHPHKVKTNEECKDRSPLQWKSQKRFKNLVFCCSALTNTEKVNKPVITLFNMPCEIRR